MAKQLGSIAGYTVHLIKLMIKQGMAQTAALWELHCKRLLSVCFSLSEGPAELKQVPALLLTRTAEKHRF